MGGTIPMISAGRYWKFKALVAFGLVLALGAACGAEPAAKPDPKAFWSFQPLRRVTPPVVHGAANPIDAFWLQTLAEKGLKPSAEAPRRVLARRMAFDLTGLPPTTAEVAAYEADRSPHAVERFAAAKMASPHFGERWGRHWLDLARYADSAGFERDSDRPTAWRYRDWVVRAINDDLPFDRFVEWQVAGDQLAPGDLDAAVATAFLGLGTEVETDSKLAEELARYRYAELDDMLSTVGGAFLGLTIGCARCHDHKYDPITMREYYGMLCAFTPVERFALPVEPGRGTNSPTAFAVRDGAKPVRNVLLRRGDPALPGDEVSPLAPAALERGVSMQERLRDNGGRPRGALARWLTDVDHGAGALLARVAVNRLWQHHFGEGLVRTPSDFGTQGDAPSHPELLEWLAGELVRNGWRMKPLHQWIVTSRCYRQAGGAAAAGDPDGRWWSRRPPVRLDAECLRDAMLDAAGVLNPAVGGPGVKPPVPEELLRTAYNTSNPYPTNTVDNCDTRRRSLYLFTKRSVRQPLIEGFDGADPAVSCPRRNRTTVAPQALALLNDALVRRWAEAFASRLEREGTTDRARVDRAYQLGLGRRPRGAELAAAEKFLRLQVRRRSADGALAPHLALTDFCQAVYCMNEFAYVD
jgi:Protein of unknown function (DUF1553)/Protein of unknown function (DUF1549)